MAKSRKGFRFNPQLYNAFKELAAKNGYTVTGAFEKIMASAVEFGLVPCTRASGRVVRHGGVTKEGSRWLRWVMVQAAQTHVHSFDSTITRMYSRVAERRGHRVALTAAANKLLLVCYSVLRNRRPYYDQA